MEWPPLPPTLCSTRSNPAYLCRPWPTISKRPRSPRILVYWPRPRPLPARYFRDSAPHHPLRGSAHQSCLSQCRRRHGLEPKKFFDCYGQNHQKNLDSRGFEPRTFHRHIYNECEAKIIPLDHKPDVDPVECQSLFRMRLERRI